MTPWPKGVVEGGLVMGDGVGSSRGLVEAQLMLMIMTVITSIISLALFATPGPDRDGQSERASASLG